MNSPSRAFKVQRGTYLYSMAMMTLRACDEDTRNMTVLVEPNLDVDGCKEL